ncbi:hypothetical protein [Brockia lithotrophica]|uniref:Uncharacterized protein n=1 Tax=Brockia lithotrophica TaxID=933949 RepID=A0A660KZ19_9BACL|nr:hypothetical protein [Brockia lithotrophica]RKQ85597.1 hypothetical protein C7438_1001 [Brockia lithotrophica]
MRIVRRGVAAFALSASLLLPVIPAFAQGNALGDLLTAVGQLVGSTEINAQAKAGIQTSDGVRVTAVAATKETAGGLTGVVSSLLGGSTEAGACVTYGEYYASSRVKADNGLASTTRALGALLAGLGSSLSGK